MRVRMWVFVGWLADWVAGRLERVAAFADRKAGPTVEQDWVRDELLAYRRRLEDRYGTPR